MADQTTKSATKKQRGVLNELRVFNDLEPFKFDTPMTSADASAAIAEFMQKRDEVIPAQWATIRDVALSHKYRYPVGSEGRKSTAEVAKDLIGLTNAEASRLVVENNQAVVQQMESGERESSWITPKQQEMLKGIRQYEPEIAEKVGIPESMDTPLLAPAASILIQEARNLGVDPSYIGARLSNDQKRDAQAKQPAPDLTR